MSQTIFGELFTRNNRTYYLLSKSDFVIPRVRTVFKGSSSISKYGPIIWNLVPREIKCLDTLESLKSKIRMWKPKDCLCCICKNYIPKVGFLETFE